MIHSLSLTIIATVIVTLSSLSSRADQAQTLKALEPLKKHYSNDLYLSGKFIQENYLSDLGVTLDSSGEFQLYKMNKNEAIIDWHIKSPEDLHVCLFNQTAFIKDIGSSKITEYTLSDAGGKNQNKVSKLLSFLNMDTTIIAESFDAELKGQKITLSPKPDEKDVKKIVIQFDKNQIINQVEFTEPNNNVLTVKYRDVVKSKPPISFVKDCKQILNPPKNIK